jgi:hypothetical protein
MYADDSTQEVSGQSVKEVEQKLTEDFGSCGVWMAKNKLTLHVGKTKSQLIGTTRKVTCNTKLQVQYNGKVVEQVSEAKVLGVRIDSNLSWAPQHDSVCKKVSQRIGILRRIRSLVSQDVAKKLYNSLVLPHLDFCCTVWGRPTNKVYTDNLTKLQKRAARIILQCKIRDFSSRELFDMLHWMPFEKRVNFKTSILMYKCVNGISPDYLQIFNLISNHHSHHTRAAARNNLSTTRSKLSTCTRSFQYQGERLWNSLPPHVRAAPSVNSFKSMYCKQ